ncbi:MAG: NAD(P)H-quinone oxidoreductase [Gemmatimonadaceae bacterium]|nr:NAD(P)H-quinone oxidoreductase [Gemmatimonadaceae bacterium]
MSLPSVMRAAVITAPGAPDVFAIEARPLPVPGPDEILVRVRSSAINRADVLQRQGRYPAPPGVAADIPGLEFAGEVAAVGAGVTLWSVGARVSGLVGGAAHAEYLVTHQRAVAAVPDAVSWALAGAAPEACITALDALDQAGATAGESVLVHAVGSGVGLATVQIAKQLGCRVYGTARGVAKLDAARDVGMDDGASPADGDWIVDAVRRWTNKRGVDVVVDLVGGDYVRHTLPAMALKGRLIVVGTLAGQETQLDLRYLLGRRLTLRGTVLRSRPLDERIAVTDRYAAVVLPWLASGAVTVRIDATFPLERIAEAHALMESNTTIGKIALDIAS